MPKLVIVFVCVLASSTVLAAPAADEWKLWDRHAAGNMAVVDHSEWQRLLDRYVSPDDRGVNRVAYARISAQDRTSLNDYLDALASIDPRDYDKAEQLAYWINLYNALTVEVVLRHPRKGSILRMGKGLFKIGPWDDPLVTIAGHELTLNDIEHRILRPIWRDHRIHFAVNCASIGCPNLAKQAYTSDNVEALLAAGEVAYVNHPRGVEFDKRGRLHLSQIFNWYREDFAEDTPALLAYLSTVHRTASERLRSHEGSVKYRYDWALNKAPD